MKDDGKVQGSFTKEQFQYAIYKYFEDNYNSTFKPMLNKRNLSTGDLIYKDHGELTASMVKQYTEKYYGN